MAAPDHPAFTLMSIAVYFHNDRDDGFGLRFSAGTRPTAVEIDAAIAEALPQMRTMVDPASTDRAALAGLHELAKLSKIAALDAEQAVAAALNIAWAVERGIIIDGEYDGIAYVFDVGSAVGQPPGTVH